MVDTKGCILFFILFVIFKLGILWILLIMWIFGFFNEEEDIELTT